jgi:hypothetical protein
MSKSMAVIILIEGTDADLLTRDLRNWLQSSEIDDFSVDFGRVAPTSGTLGAELPTSLILVSKKLLADLVAKPLVSWIKVKKPKIKMTFKSGNSQFVLDVENVQIDEALVENLKSLLSSISRSRS